MAACSEILQWKEKIFLAMWINLDNVMVGLEITYEAGFVIFTVSSVVNFLSCSWSLADV